jgi:hypothetical protein
MNELRWSCYQAAHLAVLCAAVAVGLALILLIAFSEIVQFTRIPIVDIRL